MIIDTPDGIEAFRLLSLRGRLQLETRTKMKFRMCCTHAIRDVIGSKTRNKKKLLFEFESWLREHGVLSEEKKCAEKKYQPL